ncbi:AAA family ATPase [Enterococcus sp. HY326]|uniref:AAA family ATPase n=1 Tax=Enterococcus sp. HY326 TaxID=2971265 RepID=UPI0022404717|nr:AAA family ATPase [Enterococcus sp. HY326]
MKKLILIGGPMGIGKSTVTAALNEELENSVMLDGDWCWQMHPWQFTEENKQMVLKNIQFLLQSFIDNSSFDFIIFCWVMDHQEIINDVLAGLTLTNTEVTSVSLVASPQKLAENIQIDIAKGLRDFDSITTAIARLENYRGVESIKIDTTALDVPATVAKIKDLIS